jgi:dTDP-4-amino-4,6-dideoxygalactose transaminase
VKIPFNKVFRAPSEGAAVCAYLSGQDPGVGGDAYQACVELLRSHVGVEHMLLTGSCTQALELAALALNIQPGDEVIVPTYTFPSTANAFALFGAKILFADSLPYSPHVDPNDIIKKLSSRTKAVVVMHYGGIACDVSALLPLLEAKGIVLVEDAAHALGATYDDKPLGTFGSFGAFSFHSTKNLSCEQGGALLFPGRYGQRIENISSKGTNQLAAKRHEVPFYEWVELGSASRISEVHAILLANRLPHLARITEDRCRLWERYLKNLQALATSVGLQLPRVPTGAKHNAHVFFMITRGASEASQLTSHLAGQGIEAFSHYVPLHTSAFGRRIHSAELLPHAERISGSLVRLPLWHGLTDNDVDAVCGEIESFYR